MYRVADDHGTRLDVFLSEKLPDLSRSRIQAAIRGGSVRVNSHPSKPSHKLKRGDQVAVTIPPSQEWILQAEFVPFGVIHEDRWIIVINKPPGLVVHPAPGHASGTLVHGLLKHCRVLSASGGPSRPGIVHRLDKDTSGLIVVAKNDPSHAFLAEQFKSGRVTKEYVALVHGKLKAEKGEIDRPIGRNPRQRKKMAVVQSGGRPAFTKWRRVEEFSSGFSLLSVSIRTGRTHQIRVHLSHAGHPVAGDPVYGYGRRWWKNNPLCKKGLLPVPERQMLHAACLGFVHPGTKIYAEFEADIPGDMAELIGILRSLEKIRS